MTELNLEPGAFYHVLTKHRGIIKNRLCEYTKIGSYIGLGCPGIRDEVLKVQILVLGKHQVRVNTYPEAGPKWK